LTSLIASHISSGTLDLSTGATSAAINVTGLSTLQTVTATHVSAATMNMSTGITSGTLMVNNIDMTPNVGDVITTKSFTAGNNVTSPAAVTGLNFPYESVRSFEAQLGVALSATAGNLYAQYRISGLQKSSGVWVLNTSYIGDNCGVTFSMETSGQLVYTSTNYPSFQSNIFTFEARALSM